MALKILLVDDSAIVRKVVIRTLGLTNIEVGEVFQAENGLQALEILKSTWVDLIFLDINMPVMNGMEFMEKLRVDEDLKDIPVIVVSTEGSKERIRRLEELGIWIYLRKPVTPETLTQAVAEILKEGGAEV